MNSMHSRFIKTIPLFPTLSKKAGQSALFITLIACVVILVSVNVSIGLFNQQSGKRLIASTKALQSYYVAMHGIQEAMATRMVPRSNQMNFSNRRFAAYPHSGRVYRKVNIGFNGSGPLDTNLMGIYRYIIVGGDAFRMRNGAAQGLSARLLQFASFPTESSPFYIISNGITCNPVSNLASTRGDGVALPFVTFPAGNNLNPLTNAVCPPGFVIEQTTLVARALIERDAPAAGGPQIYNLDKDQLQGLQAFLGDNFSLPADVAQGGGAFIPGQGYINDNRILSFQALWQNQDVPLVTRVVTTTRANVVPPPGSVPLGPFQVIDQFNNPNGSSNVTLPTVVPLGSTIIVAFDRPFEFRSIYDPTNAFDITNCVGVRGGAPTRNCSVSLFAGGGAIPQPLNFAPVLPGSNVLVIVPSLQPGLSRTIPLRHTLTISGLRNYSGLNTIGQATITFRVEGARDLINQ
ncbi:MAG: hypothetical protein K2X66_07605 [Cyanobacteria bacterium]|nr:hypothetical protein [Cyanobacteriota bacterium]